MSARRSRNKPDRRDERRGGDSLRRRWAVSAWAALVVIAGLALAYLWPGRGQADLRRIDGQNVLLITIDTLRADALSCYGGPAATPALDRLAAEGVRFDFAHAHAVITLTSHASILTGQYPFQHGLRDNSGYRLPRSARTTATMLQHAGYATAAFVGAFPVHSQFGLNVGFDVYDDRFGDGTEAGELTTPERPATTVVALARQWIAARPKGRPWFVWVHVFDPHAPYQPPPPFDTQYASQPYYGEVAATDAALAPLLEAARTSEQPTLVIATGDHGEGLGDHGEQAHGIFAYESTLRVPLIIAELGGARRRPQAEADGGRTGHGEVSPVAARHVDILPTILDAVGQPVPADLPGRTLLPAAERRGLAEPRPTYFEALSGMLNHGWAPLTGVLVGRDKFIDLPLAERYDLTVDGRERSNLFGREPERDRALVASLRMLGPAMPGPRLPEDRETRQRLRALGYVSASVPPKARFTEADDPKRLIGIDNQIHEAINAYFEGRADESLRIYQDVISRRPDMPFPYRRIAAIEWARGNSAGAVKVLRGALAVGITDGRLRVQLGEYLTDLGQPADGVRLIEPLALDPNADSDTLNALGIAYARAGRLTDARRTFERLIDVLPGSSAPYENLGVLALEQGDARAARGYFERAAALAPGSSKAQMGLGAAASQAGDRQAAYAAWGRALELAPDNLDALYSLGVNLAHDGRMAEARPYLEHFLKVAPPAVPAGERRDVERLLKSGR